MKSIKAVFYTRWLRPLFSTPAHKTLRAGKVALRRGESYMSVGEARMEAVATAAAEVRLGWGVDPRGDVGWNLPIYML